MTIIRVHLYISGRVQGVYYRKNAQQEALKRGLKGWVKNLPDRRVEAVVEGEEEQVEDFIRWCWKGPPLSIVRGVETQRQPPTGGFETFDVRY